MLSVNHSIVCSLKLMLILHRFFILLFITLWVSNLPGTPIIPRNCDLKQKPSSYNCDLIFTEFFFYLLINVPKANSTAAQLERKCFNVGNQFSFQELDCREDIQIRINDSNYKISYVK